MPIENLRVGSMVVAVALALAIAAGVWFGSRSATPDVLTSSGGVSYTTVPEAVVVHVSGAVNRPGLVTISSSARVADAIAGAGGAVAGADLAGLNLASSVRDGDQIVVPLVGAATAPGQAKDRGHRPESCHGCGARRSSGCGAGIGRSDHRLPGSPWSVRGGRRPAERRRYR